MTHPGTPNFAVFVLASLILAITPGPGVVYLVTRTLDQGRGAGFASIAGVAVGNFANAAIACFGLAVVFAVSPRSFMIVKLAGAAYLVFLGLKALRRTGPPARNGRLSHAPRTGAFRDGVLVALLNPKTAVFFAAFIPEFENPSGSPLGEGLFLGGIFVLIAACTDGIYVFVAGALGPRILHLRSRERLGRYIAGGTFITLGLFVALNGLGP
jgi:threonine/homoserine/homoserine lactone efflux protein